MVDSSESLRSRMPCPSPRSPCEVGAVASTDSSVVHPPQNTPASSPAKRPKSLERTPQESGAFSCVVRQLSGISFPNRRPDKVTPVHRYVSGSRPGDGTSRWVELTPVKHAKAAPESEVTRTPEKASSLLVSLVRQVELNDPDLKRVDLSTLPLPLGEADTKEVLLLLEAVGRNGQLQELILEGIGLSSAAASVLASSLARNDSLRVLDLRFNRLEPADLRIIFSALARNRKLQELNVTGQLLGSQRQHVGRETFAAVLEVLSENRVLRKIGMDLTDAHWRDCINRSLLRNIEEQRRARQAPRLAADMDKLAGTRVDSHLVSYSQMARRASDGGA